MGTKIVRSAKDRGAITNLSFCWSMGGWFLLYPEFLLAEDFKNAVKLPWRGCEAAKWDVLRCLLYPFIGAETGRALIRGHAEITPTADFSIFTSEREHNRYPCTQLPRTCGQRICLDISCMF